MMGKKLSGRDKGLNSCDIIDEWLSETPNTEPHKYSGIQIPTLLFIDL
jgi:hypothetical protein